MFHVCLIISKKLGMQKHANVYKEYFPSKIFRVASTQPECFAPHVDVTRAPLAWGPWAMPKLVRM